MAEEFRLEREVGPSSLKASILKQQFSFPIKSSQTVTRCHSQETDSQEPKQRQLYSSINLDDLVTTTQTTAPKRSHLSQELDLQLGLQSGSVVCRSSQNNSPTSQEHLPKPCELRSRMRRKRGRTPNKPSRSSSIVAFDEHLSSLRRKAVSFHWTNHEIANSENFPTIDASVAVKREKIDGMVLPATMHCFSSNIPDSFERGDWMPLTCKNSLPQPNNLLWDTDDVDEPFLRLLPSSSQANTFYRAHLQIGHGDRTLQHGMNSTIHGEEHPALQLLPHIGSKLEHHMQDVQYPHVPCTNFNPFPPVFSSQYSEHCTAPYHARNELMRFPTPEE